MKEKRVKEALDSIARLNIPEDANLWPSIAFRVDERKSLIGSLRARPALLALVLLLSLALVSGAVYAVGRLTGFIPGFGFTKGDVYFLKAPVQVVQNGITLRLEDAVYDGSRLWVELSAKNLPAPDELSQVYLLSPGGKHLLAQRGGAIMPDENTLRLTYLFPIEELSQTVIIIVENPGGESFEIKFALRPAHADEVLPALPEAGLPVQGEMHDGLALLLENVAMSADRTVLQVSLRFENSSLSLAAPWSVTMIDAEGRAYPLKNITPETLDIGTTRLYQTVALQGNERITLALVSFPPDEEILAFMDFSLNPATFNFDPGQSPQVGQTWSLDERMQIGAFVLHLVGARMTAPGELLFEFEPEGNVTGVMLWSAFASSATGGVPVDGNFATGITFNEMPDGPFEIQVSSVYYTVHGPWEVEWQAPAAVAANFPTMTPAPAPTPLATPTFILQVPLLLEVQSLSEKFDHTIVQGPSWVHVISENTSEHLQPGQTYPPPYYQDEQWNEIDAEGWVTRNLTTHRDVNGNILQQSVSIGTNAFNFTTGETFEISPYRLSFDLFVQGLDYAMSHRETVMREETTCEDGSTCLLVTINSNAGGRRVWINLQTGQQVMFQTFQRLVDGTEQTQFTQRFVRVERVTALPPKVLDILARVVTP